MRVLLRQPEPAFRRPEMLLLAAGPRRLALAVSPQLVAAERWLRPVRVLASLLLVAAVRRAR